MKITLRYLGAALSVILVLSLLTACGGQSYQGEEASDSQSETVDADGFEAVDESSADSGSSETEESSSETSDTNSETTENKDDGNNSGTVDLPILPL